MNNSKCGSSDKELYSNAHWFSFLTSSSSSGVKSFLMLNVFLISSGVLPVVKQHKPRERVSFQARLLKTRASDGSHTQ